MIARHTLARTALVSAVALLAGAFAPPSPAAPDLPERMEGSTAPTPLAPDIDGFAGGAVLVDGNDADGKTERAMRIYPSVSGYWLAGARSLGGSGYQAFIASIGTDGTPNLGFGASGVLRAALPFFPLDVANKPNTNRFYYAGYYQTSPSADFEFAVYCLEGTDGTPCSGFGSVTAGLEIYPIDNSGAHNDFVSRIAYHGGRIYLVGTASADSSDDDRDIAIAVADAETGQLLPTFGNRPGRPGTMVFPIDYVTGGTDLAHDVKVTDAGGPGGHRIYILGETQRSTDGNDTDGIVLALNADTGLLDTTFANNGRRVVYADLGATVKKDELRAMTITRDGDIVFAGSSMDDNGYRYPLLSKSDIDGYSISGFCGNVNGTCAEPHALSTYQAAIGIAERSGTRDLVLLTAIKDDFSGGDGHYLTNVVQLGRNGSALHGLAFIDTTGSGSVRRGTNPASLYIDSDNRVLVAATRTWSATPADYDMLLARFVDTDTIFADQFETVR